MKQPFLLLMSGVFIAIGTLEMILWLAGADTWGLGIKSYFEAWLFQRWADALSKAEACSR